MPTLFLLTSVAIATLLAAVPAALAQTAGASALRVGAAKVDVTPAVGELPKHILGIHDRLFARAIVLENGTTSAALVTVDAGAVSDETWQAVTRQVDADLGIRPANVLLTATHTHSAPPQTGPAYAGKIVQAVREARERLAPARIGYGTGVSYVNVNRHVIDPVGEALVGRGELRRPI
jgi:hypothetical protein